MEQFPSAHFTNIFSDLLEKSGISIFQIRSWNTRIPDDDILLVYITQVENVKVRMRT